MISSTTHIYGSRYEITVETTDMDSFEAIMRVVYEQKEREEKEQCGKKSQQPSA